jgi:hypothetical protein
MVLLKNDGLLPLNKADACRDRSYVEQRRALLGGWTNAGLLAETAPCWRDALQPQTDLLTYPAVF